MRIISTVAGLQKIHQKVRIISITFIIRGIIRQKKHSLVQTQRGKAAEREREREGMKKRTHSDSVNMVTKQPVG